MSFLSSPLSESFPATRFSSPAPSPTLTETDLPIDVDQSFNSSMSISDASYLSPTPCMLRGKASPPRSHSHDDYLSPPTGMMFKPRRPDPVPIQSKSERLFGNVLSTNLVASGRGSTFEAPSEKGKGMMLPPAVPSKNVKRPAPMQWTASNDELGDRSMRPTSLARHETEPLYSTSPKSQCSSDQDMDMDSPAWPARRLSAAHASPAFRGSVSFGAGSPGLGDFFCDSPVAPVPPPNKRRSLVSGSPAATSDSPSAKRASLTRNMERAASSSGALLFPTRPANGSGARSRPFKRPALLPIPSLSETSFSSGPTTAEPVMYPSKQASSGPFSRIGTAPMRRAFSVCDQPAMPEMSEDESEFDASPCVGVLPQGRRPTARQTPSFDGSPGAKAVRASIAVTGQGGAVSPCRKGRVESPFGHRNAMPGFGDEMVGKILPCHQVRGEDGLVRITAKTLEEVIAGRYADKIKRYHIIDCRFAYEFAGGHIADAMNVNSHDSLESLLLSQGTGVHSEGGALPSPSRSGEQEGEQVVLIFHCEFSAKRAPTFAKHLRKRDREINVAHYPKIFFPEVYILEGGYSAFYQCHSDRCDPKGYTPMDDPQHATKRASDLHDFRKFNRTRSFTYGEDPMASASGPSSAASAAVSRAMPSLNPLAFAAASAAQGRRSGAASTALSIAEEAEHEADASPLGLLKLGNSASPNNFFDADSVDGSPCVRVSGGAAPVFGSAKPRALGRLGFSRVQSYAGHTGPASTTAPLRPRAF